MEKFFLGGGDQQEPRRRSVGERVLLPLWATSSLAGQEGALAKSVQAEEFVCP